MNLSIENPENPEEDFKRIAAYLINDCVLVAGENEYQFTTLEFYYKHKDYPDPYTHGHDIQTTYGKLYFHPSGLDITFGSNEDAGNAIYGGILIRGLKIIKDDLKISRNAKAKKEYPYINGPLICVQELFQNFGDIFDLKSRLSYIKESRPEVEALKIKESKIYWSRRVGLNENIDTTQDQRYYKAPHRFFIDPKETQTDKGNIAEDLVQQFGSEDEVNKLFGYKHFKITE